AITDNTDIAIQLDIRQTFLLCLKLQGIRLLRLCPGGIFFLTEQAVIIDQDFGIGGLYLSIGCEGEGIDFSQAGITLDEGSGEGGKNSSAFGDDFMGKSSPC